MCTKWKEVWKLLIANRSFNIVKRIFICVVILLVFYLFVIWLLTPPKEAQPVFAYKSGELNCETHEECVKMAREKTIKEWENQKQLFEYMDRWSQFVGFSILPLRYEIDLENRSYNQIETTGPMGEKRQLPAKVICGVPPFIEIWSFPFLKGIEKNLALKNVYSTMETLLKKFDGCYFDLTYMNYSVNASLSKDKLVVGSSEYVKLSNEREFVFPVRLDGLSRIFILLQILFVGLPIVLLVPKPIIKFVTKGKEFFIE